jgi:transcriptional regulator with XRE-family HTH domain
MTASQATLTRPQPSMAVPPALLRDGHDHPWSDACMTDHPRGNPEFAKRLRAARKAADMTQRELAKAVGVSAAMVTHWETGFRGIWLEHLMAAADALGVDRASLVPGVPPPAPIVFAGPFVCEECRARQRRRKRPFRTTRRRAQ